MSKYIIRNGIPIRIEDSINFEALDYIRQEKKLSGTKKVNDSTFNKGDAVKISNNFHVYQLAGQKGIITSVSKPDVDGDIYYDIKFTTGPEKGNTKSFTNKYLVKDNNTIKDELSEKDYKELGIRDMIAFTQQRIRSLINGEYEAIDGYTSAITEFMRNYKETNDELYNQLAMVLADIKKEEFPHVGELNKCLSLIDEEEGKLFNKGVREAKKTVEKSMAPQEQEQVEE